MTTQELKLVSDATATDPNIIAALGEILDAIRSAELEQVLRDQAAENTRLLRRCGELQTALVRLVNVADGQKPIGDMDQYKRLVAERDAAVAQARAALNAQPAAI